MKSSMEMIYIDYANNAFLKTGIGAMMEDNAATWASFNAVRKYAVPTDKAEYMIDYHNRKGDLADTIPISKSAFESITGEKAKSAKQWRKVDAELWKKHDHP